MRENHRATFEYDESLMNAIAARCTEAESGARNIDAIINGTLLPEIAKEILGHMAEGEKITSVRVDVAADGKFEYKIT